MAMKLAAVLLAALLVHTEATGYHLPRSFRRISHGSHSRPTVNYYRPRLTASYLIPPTVYRAPQVVYKPVEGAVGCDMYPVGDPLGVCYKQVTNKGGAYVLQCALGTRFNPHSCGCHLHFHDPRTSSTAGYSCGQGGAVSKPQVTTTARAEAVAVAAARTAAAALAQAQAVSRAEARAEAALKALVQVQAQTRATAQASATAIASAKAEVAAAQLQAQEALVQVQAQVRAQAQAEAVAKGQDPAQAPAQAQAQAQAVAKVEAPALAVVQAESVAKEQTPTQAQAQTQTQGQFQLQGPAQSLPLTQTHGQSEAQALAQAQARARTQAQAQAQVLTQVQSLSHLSPGMVDILQSAAGSSVSAFSTTGVGAEESELFKRLGLGHGGVLHWYGLDSRLDRVHHHFS